MRVLHFYKTSVPDSRGGVEQVINQIARGTSALGIQTDVLSLSAEGAPTPMEIDGYTAHRAKINLRIASTEFSLSAIARFSALAKRADVVHYHFPWPFMDVVHFLSRVNKPTVLTYHSDIIRQRRLLKLYKPLQHCFLSSVDRIVATSPNYLETSPVLKKFAHKVRVIPIGLDRSTYPSPDPERVRHWRETLGPKFFLFVGVLRYYKGLHILIDAARDTGFPVAIVGAGPIERELREHAQRVGASNIQFLGFLAEEDKVALLEACYAVTFPSHLRSEAFGVSLLEGAMFGKPMISSEIGTGTTFVNIAGETGLVIAPGNSDALRAAMKQLWEHPDEAARMGKGAQLRFQEHFRARQMIDAYATLYGEVLQQRPAVGATATRIEMPNR